MALPWRVLIMRSHRVVAVARLASRLDPSLRPCLSSLRQLVIFINRLTLATTFCIAKRYHASDLGCQVLDHVASQLLLLSFVLNNQSLSVIFIHIRPPHLFDFVQDKDKDFFLAFIALGAVGSGVADVAASDVCGAVDGEGDAVGHFLAPA